MATSAGHPKPLLAYSEEVEAAIGAIERHLRAGEYGLSPRSVSLLILQGDEEMLEHVELQEGHEAAQRIREVVNGVDFCPTVPLAYHLMVSRQAKVEELTSASMRNGEARRSSFADALGVLCSRPWTGFPILALVLYFGLYQFVGIFGGGTLVGLIEEDLFGGAVNPWVTSLVGGFAAAGSPVYELLVGEYGVWTLGVTYAVALILPIITAFFLMFSVLEDSGYLPRLALLVDRMFKKIGLNGRGVIPIVLGFGCDTMATVVTRILETRRERVIATFLLSLAIPCSAQLGVITAILAARGTVLLGPGIAVPTLLAVWGLIMTAVFLLAGFLAAKLTPGVSAPFYLELPPMRWPSLSNVVAKTLARVQWYFLEVFPLFVLASVVIWLGMLKVGGMAVGWPLLLAWAGFALGRRWRLGGRFAGALGGAAAGWLAMLAAGGSTAFEAAIASLRPLARFLTLPEATAETFLFGFFSRDYGAAGLDRLAEGGGLSPAQLLVAAVAITLFLPCIAQFLVVRKERGLGMAVGMLAFTVGFAAVVGAGLAQVLRLGGWLS